MTRAMLFTVLYRMSGGADEIAGETWYSVAMAWAKSEGVSDGSNPDGSITREQLVTMLYRYAGSPEVTGGLSAYSDTGAISDYALDAMTWAVSQGIVSGISEDVLDPAGTATRAQVAAILVRYLETA